MKVAPFYLKFLTILITLSVTQIAYSDLDVNCKSVNPQTKEYKTYDFSAYPHLSEDMKERFNPYMISDTHPMKSKLDKLFSKKRITKDKNEFVKAGFKILDERPRSYVIVARHSELKDHLVKCYLDTERRQKWDRPSWKWLVDRCRGAEKVRKSIEKHNFKHFTVADKWIYIPKLLETKPPFKECYRRHPAILCVTDMKLVSEKENLYAWKTKITKEMLKELYTIMDEADGSSYRADNIAYSKYYDKFCFIDCEYPGRRPNFSKIAVYMNTEMKEYWYKLVKNKK